MPFTAIYRDETNGLHEVTEEHELRALLDADRGLVWVNIAGTDERDAEMLGRLFPFHPLSIRHCLEARYQRPQASGHDDHVFLMLHGIDHIGTSELVETSELDLFIGLRYVVSAHIKPMPAIDELFASVTEHREMMARGSALLAHVIVDAMLESVTPTVERMTEIADAIEEEALEAPVRELLQDILNLKRSALRIHRVMVPQRDVLNRVARSEFIGVPEEAHPYFRDLADYVGRIEDLTVGLRERADNALTTYLSSVSIRQNETMRVLSIVASVFLPLTLLAGIYGMNFEYMPELGWRYGYFAVIAVMVLVSSAVIWIFWARNLIGTGRRRVVSALSYRVEHRVLREAVREAARLRNFVVEATRPRRP